VLRSEIPQLEVITAIADAESEDFLAQLLFSQGWNIIFRALDADSLRHFMTTRSIELRTVIIYLGDFPGLLPGELEKLTAPTVTTISIDNIPINSHLLMTHIRSSLRSPMIRDPLVNEERAPLMSANQFVGREDHQYEARTGGRAGKTGSMEKTGHDTDRRSELSPGRNSQGKRLVAITGTAGSPGRTRFSLLLAEECAKSQRVLIVDADIKSQGLTRQRDQIRRPEIDLLSLDVENRPTAIAEEAPVMIVDMGPMPVMAEAVTDRRWHGTLINNVLNSATHVVYLSKSTQVSMSELSQFLREYPILLKRVPITYICILTGHSRELRQWESRFLTLTEGENRQIIREDQLKPQSETTLFPFFRPGSGKRREIAKIANLLR
jgi:hypothetical protein